MIKLILKRAAPIPKIESFNKFLFVGPHPDDIEIGCGAAIAKLASAGKTIRFVVVTDGCVGSVNPDLSGKELVEIRQNECRDAMEILGVKDIVFLPYNDGGMYNVTDVEKSLAAEIVRFQPDVVFCPDPRVPTECHPDHIKVGEATTYAVTAFAPWKYLTDQIGLNETCMTKLLAYYYTHRPNAYVTIGKFFAHQDAALKCFTSQFTESDLKLLSLYRRLRAVRFGLKRLRGKSDGYRVLPPLHQHCFPEASEF